MTKRHGFGTDAMLLAAFSAPHKNDRACDLCSGCGIIPLLWCRDGLCREIAAVEIHPDACAQMRQSVEMSAAEEKLKIVNADLRGLDGVLGAGEYSLVSANPPYFKAGSGYDNREEAALLARSETGCTLDDVVKAAARLLKYSGRFCLCQRPERLADVLCSMRANGIEPKKLRPVAAREGAAPWLILVEGRRGGKPGMIYEKTFFVHGTGAEYSDEMKALMGDYYSK